MEFEHLSWALRKKPEMIQGNKKNYHTEWSTVGKIHDVLEVTPKVHGGYCLAIFNYLSYIFVYFPNIL